MWPSGAATLSLRQPSLTLIRREVAIGSWDRSPSRCHWSGFFICCYLRLRPLKLAVGVVIELRCLSGLTSYSAEHCLGISCWISFGSTNSTNLESPSTSCVGALWISWPWGGITLPTKQPALMRTSSDWAIGSVKRSPSSYQELGTSNFFEGNESFVVSDEWCHHNHTGIHSLTLPISDLKYVSKCVTLI